MSGLAEVTSPPYDVIAAENESQLIAMDPHNVVRLILPRHDPGQPGSPYTDAARELSGLARRRDPAAGPGPGAVRI